MNSVENFLKWFQGMGGRVPPNIEEVLNTRYVYNPEPVSSFKDRAEYIKKKYNYKFKGKPICDHDLSGFPDISKINFVKNEKRN